MVRWIFPPPVVLMPMRDLGLILTHVAVQCPPLTGSLGVRRPIPFFLAPGPSRRGLCKVCALSNADDLPIYRRFSGDESFSAAEKSSEVDAGVALGVVVEGTVRPDKASPHRGAAGHHRL